MRNLGQTLIRATAAVLTGAAVLVCSSCGWEAKAVWPSPNGSAQVEIEQKLPVNLWGLRTVLVSRGQTIVLKEQRGDSDVSFAEVYWEKDSGAVAVYACGIQRLKVAYSLKEGRALPFDPFEAKIAARIRDEYRRPADEKDAEVFAWACVHGGDEFHRRFRR
jgi:hypothetical protein